MFLVETGEGRVFTICKQCRWSAYLACIEILGVSGDSWRYNLAPTGRGVRGGISSTYLKKFRSCWRSEMG